ncbi:MAG: AAA family ATPase [Planctomycetota bacterium]
MALSTGLDSDAYQEHASLLQRICQKLPGSTADSSQSSDPIGFQFIDQLARFMEECSRDKPCVLVLNNLHWADDPTVVLLQRLVERVRHEDSGSRLLIVLTMRDDDHRSKPLLEFLEDNSEAGSLD